MNWALYGAAGYLVASILIYISKIGEPREPIKPSDAVVLAILGGAMIAIMTLAGWRLT